jgi:peptidoglycan/xylan/chitin deacetylase (PgdA/CDA1 family)
VSVLTRHDGVGRDPLVLCYHALSDTWPADLAVTTHRFREQLRWLHRNGYRTATLTDALTHRRRRTVAVTFDDAYRSLLNLALPILQEFNAVATVFTVTRFADSGGLLSWPGIDQWSVGAHAGELEGLRWDDLQTLQRAGWEVGSHTCTHPRLTTLSDEALRDELRSSKRACEEVLDQECAALAYPYGDVDGRVVDAAVAAGYRYAVTLAEQLHRAQPHGWPRIGVYRPDSVRRFRLKVSPATRSVRLLIGR